MRLFKSRQWFHCIQRSEGWHHFDGCYFTTYCEISSINTHSIHTFCRLFKLANHLIIHLQFFWSFSGLFLGISRKTNFIYKVASQIHSNETSKPVQSFIQNTMLCSRYFKFCGSTDIKAVRYWSCPLNRNRGRITPCQPSTPKRAQTCEKNLPEVGLKPTTSRLWGRCSTDWATVACYCIWLVCGVLPKWTMRFTANKNVALSASTKAA